MKEIIWNPDRWARGKELEFRWYQEAADWAIDRKVIEAPYVHLKDRVIEQVQLDVARPCEIHAEVDILGWFVERKPCIWNVTLSYPNGDKVKTIYVFDRNDPQLPPKRVS